MKYERHAKILDLIEAHAIETQDELAEKLRKSGMDVTQATVSRDIKELRLVKVMTEDGRYRYAAMFHESISAQEGAPGQDGVTASPDNSAMSGRLLIILREAFVSSDYANNILVIKTLPGMAQAVASSVDALGWNEILGSIAGDDTLMVICRAEKFAEELMERFSRMVKGA